MMGLRCRLLASICLLALTFVSSPAFAQNAEISGVVRDASGAVLPGVAVEASSPALIEKTRTVFTDGQGQFRIIALQAGVYKVTFSLTGFGTVVRDAITLTSSFTATVNVTMSVGALQESVTVSSQSPLVDIQTTSQKTAIRSELLNELPTGRSFQNLAILVPGVQIPLGYGSDVGGTNGNLWQTMTIHGSRDDQMPLLINGMPFNNMNNTGGGYNHTFSLNAGATQEMTITTSGSSAESRTSGVVVNNVSKEGGNKFTANFYGEFYEQRSAVEQPGLGSAGQGPHSSQSRQTAARDQPDGRRTTDQGQAVVLRRLPRSAQHALRRQLVQHHQSRRAAVLQ